MKLSYRRDIRRIILLTTLCILQQIHTVDNPDFTPLYSFIETCQQHELPLVDQLQQLLETDDHERACELLDAAIETLTVFIKQHHDDAQRVELCQNLLSALVETHSLTGTSTQDDLARKPRETICNLLVKNLFKVCGHAYIEGQLVISPRVRAGYPLLVVQGDSHIKGELVADSFYVSGATTLGDVLFHDATIGGTLTVVGASHMSTLIAGTEIVNNLSVSSNASIGNTLTTNNLTVTSTANLPPMGNMSILGTLSVEGATDLNNTLTVHDESFFNNVTISGVATIAQASINDALIVSGTLDVAGSTTLASVTSATFSTTDLDSSGLATLDNVSISTTLDVTGSSTLNSLDVTNNATVGGTLGVTGTTNLDVLNAGSTTLDTLSVDSNASITGNLDVTGSSTLNSVTVTTNATVDGIFGVTGTTNLDVLNAGSTTLDTLSVDSNASITGNLDISGISTCNSTVNIAPSSAVDALIITPNAGSVDGIQINNPINADVGGFAFKVENGTPTSVFSVAHTSGNTSIAGTLGVTGTTSVNTLNAGATSVSTLTTSGAATMDSAAVTKTITASIFNIASEPSTATTNMISINNFPFIHTIGGNTNFFAGRFAGNNSVTGINNTCVGAGAGNQITSGYKNTLIGQSAGSSITTGLSNTCVGSTAGYKITTGVSNVCIGLEAGQRLLSSSSGNVCIGLRTGPLLMDASGNSNIFIGPNSGNGFRGGNNNIMIGTQGPAAAFSNRIYFGSQTQSQLYLLSDAGTATTLPGQTIAGNVVALTIDSTTGAVGMNVSSARYKTDIQPLSHDTIQTLDHLEPIRFKVNHTNNAQAYGLTAEQVATVDPILVAYNSEGQPEAVHYQMIIPLLIKAYQRQQEQIVTQQQHITNLETRLTFLEA